MPRIIIMGAAGRDFHEFNIRYRHRADDRVVAFTAAQIPNISERIYPPELAGELYPTGIPIHSEDNLAGLIAELDVDDVVFAYSDVSHTDVMHKASLVLAAGANFVIPDPAETMLGSSRPVLSVCAVRTGAGKSPFVREAVRILRSWGRHPCVVRHPMPYGDLRLQASQRFAEPADLSRQDCSVEEREEYEQHINERTVVFAGIDYSQVLAAAEAEADTVIWDGGNNDLPFFRPSLHVVVADALRPGHELLYHPGETNARMADAFVITKIDRAPRRNIEIVRSNLAALRPGASISEASFELTVTGDASLQDKRVLVIEDGPTTTHGGMSTGAGWEAATRAGALVIDPRQWATASIAGAYEAYPHIGPVLPALGYGSQQLRDLEETIRAVPCDVVVVASPVDLRRLIDFPQPSVRVTYNLLIHAGPTMEEILSPLKKSVTP